jgi:hypothetical protein
MIQALIDKQDNAEIVRDEIAAILLAEAASQKALAVDAGKDPALWDLRVFTERSNPWEELNEDNATPIVNVWWENENFNESASNTVSQQQADAVFNIDCYGYGISQDDTEGHKPGDREAAFEAQRAVRLVRNILMASDYTYLGLRGLVWKRWPQSITIFQPQISERNVDNVVGARLALGVKFNEFSPQYTGVTLELVSMKVYRKETGELLLDTNFDYTL